MRSVSKCSTTAWNTSIAEWNTKATQTDLVEEKERERVFSSRRRKFNRLAVLERDGIGRRVWAALVPDESGRLYTRRRV